LRICSNCGSDKTYIQDKNKRWPRPCWAWHNGKLYCKKCSSKLFINPKYTKRRIYYNGKKHYYPFELRTGVCQWCKKKGKTHLHHIEYHDDDPLKDTIELCIACHNEESWKLGSLHNIEHSRDPITGRFIK